MEQSRLGQWLWSEQAQKYYYLDAATKEIVDQNGMRLPLSHARMLGPEARFVFRSEDTGSSKTVQGVEPAKSVVAAGTLLPDTRNIQTQQTAYRSLPLSTPSRHVEFPLQKQEEGRPEMLFPSYTVRRDANQFFKPGRVFMILWTEPAGTLSEGARPEEKFLATVRYGERVYSKIRRFVVVREGTTHCSALPISTYGGRGVGKLGVKKSDHCIIHTGHSAPLPLREEIPRRGEAGMRPISIRVIPDDGVAKLDPTSRIDLAKIHNIDHRVKVKAFGQIDALHLPALLSQFILVWPVLSPSAHVPSHSGQSLDAAAHLQKLHEAATKEGESGNDDDDGDGTSESESEGKRQTGKPKDPDMPIDFLLFDELKALQVNHMKILQLGELFGALKCSGFDTDAITAIAAAQSKSERASAVSRACKHSAQVGKDPGIQPSKLRKVTYDALLRRGYSEEQANDLLDSQLS